MYALHIAGAACMNIRADALRRARLLLVAGPRDAISPQRCVMCGRVHLMQRIPGQSGHPLGSIERALAHACACARAGVWHALCGRERAAIPEQRRARPQGRPHPGRLHGRDRGAAAQIAAARWRPELVTCCGSAPIWPHRQYAMPLPYHLNRYLLGSTDGRGRQQWLHAI